MLCCLGSDDQQYNNTIGLTLTTTLIKACSLQQRGPLTLMSHSPNDVHGTLQIPTTALYRTDILTYGSVHNQSTCLTTRY